jgi:histidinol dehydrogenase
MSDAVPSTGELRARGSLAQLDAATRRVLMSRSGEGDASVRVATADIIAAVRTRGDDALREFAQRLDGVSMDSFDVPRHEWTRALDALDPALRRALERAAANITTVHAAFRALPVEVSPEPGIVIGRRPDPLSRVGVYAPGGRAAYPSSLLMGAVPARVAGVNEVIVCSPPTPSGLPSDVVLAAAALADVSRVFAVGGAGAIAAMALGTDSVPRVDKIVGPGNAFVAEAKLQLVANVTIDSPAGPSELLVIADDTASPDVIARELVAQAEHDPEAAVIALVVGDDACVEAIERALWREVSLAPRAAIVRASLSSRGAVFRCESLADAVAFANDWAAEHLLLAVGEDVRSDTLGRLRHAGTIFVGESASVAFGDYMTGANHVLPTAGLARCYSGLSTLDFVRWTTWQSVTPAAAASLSRDVACFAEAEGLPGHAAAARAWEVRA